MTAVLKFTVLPPNSSVHADGEEFAAGEHEVEDPSDSLVKAIGSAHAVGAVEVSEGLDLSHVESDEESAAKLVEAMGDWVEPEYRPDGTREPGRWNGPWAEGHYAQVEADADARAAGDEIEIDVADVADLSDVLGEEA